MNKIAMSARLPEMTIQQMEQIKDFYDIDFANEPDHKRFSTSRIIIICVNAFWKKLFEEKHELSWIAEEILNK